MSVENRNHHQNPTETLTMELPCQMIERIKRHAKENDMNISGVLIEALDDFLRKNRHGDS